MSKGFEVEVIKKIPVKTKISLSTEQEKFCQLFVRDPKIAGKPFDCFMQVYKDQLEPHQTPEFVRKQAKELLTNDKIIQRLSSLLEEDGFDDTSVDKKHNFLIHQFADHNVALKAIQEYNKLKKRTSDQPVFVLPRPIMDLEDGEITELSKDDYKEIKNENKRID